MKSSTRLLLPLALAAASLLSAVAAHAQTAIVINSLPYNITTGGYYVLGGNLNAPAGVTSGNLITVGASNVTLDFQGYYIAGAVGVTTQTTIGVYATEKSNVTIKNGTIAFCNQGILLEGNGSNSTNAVDEVVDTMRVTYCYRFGIFIKTCPASRVVNCQVSQTGYSSGPVATGIFADGALVQNNVVSANLSTNGVGIFLKGATNYAASTAIGNVITNCPIGLSADSGTSGGKYQNNLTVSCTTTFQGGTDAGNNN